MDIPLYISIPFVVAFVHYDNHPRAWRWAWAMVRRWWRKPLPAYPPVPSPQWLPEPRTITDEVALHRGSNMPLSKMKCLTVGDDLDIHNIPKDVLLIKVNNANSAKLARVRDAFVKWQNDQLSPQE